MAGIAARTSPLRTYVCTHGHRSRWWKQPSRRRPRPAWQHHHDDEDDDAEEEGEEGAGGGDDEGSEEGEIGVEEERACVLCRDEAAGAPTAVTRCARAGCGKWLHCACALDRRCALRAPEGAADGFFCPGCEAPVRLWERVWGLVRNVCVCVFCA